MNKEIYQYPKRLTLEQAIMIEQQHNVYVDITSNMYTNGNRNDIYGWQPIPDEWLNMDKKIN